MKNQTDIILSISLVMLFAFAGFNPIGKIYSSEPVRYGDELELYVNFDNSLKTQLEDVKVKAFDYDSDEIFSANTFDIQKRSKSLSRLFWKVPQEASCGEHVVRVTASNNKFRDVRHIFFDVEC